jgi:hypothetical protein
VKTLLWIILFPIWFPIVLQLVFWTSVVVVVFLGAIVGAISSALQVHPTRYAPPAYADPTPVAELAYTGPSESEKAANWQRILEMRKATPTPATNQQYKRLDGNSPW